MRDLHRDFGNKSVGVKTRVKILVQRGEPLGVIRTSVTTSASLGNEGDGVWPTSEVGTV